jgi:hypothetical protein
MLMAAGYVGTTTGMSLYNTRIWNGLDGQNA